MTSVYEPLNSLSNKFDPKRCAGMVADGGRSVGFHQCVRKTVVQEEEHGWCKQHAPSTEKAKDTALRDKTNGLIAASRRKQDIVDARARVIETVQAWYHRDYGTGAGNAAEDELEDALAELERLEAEA